MPAFRILIFSGTADYRHISIPAGIRALKKLAEDSASSPLPRFTADASEDAEIFNPSSLSAYKVIILLQCSGEFLNPNQLDALKTFVRSGGGVVAVHCASFAMKSSKWYGQLIGGVFDNHPEPQLGEVRLVDGEHPIMLARLPGIGASESQTSATKHQIQGSGRVWFDEWYNFEKHPREASKGIRVLLSVDEQSYAGGQLGVDHPIAWCQIFDGGRCFYTSLGHFDQAYEDEWFLGQLYGGILWAAGLA
ncbi:carboxylesterase-like protein [Thermochaetoides thermophila DSM 1495]|uniref:Carboxylesterase-like protein n=1 Tax=Chaetomium thermophilum (strain DSM 1495 / CBS 144.50 / IMI 039719) TaxID=759272 RepID=G0SD41_CHATD|nr:carboxylesterase-like protein [Thermochaetoides thermophila DSM 1495]EGS18471.1 carboxylesterase-like protein [Thermochaetoides thermophila DSM 1495]